MHEESPLFPSTCIIPPDDTASRTERRRPRRLLSNCVGILFSSVLNMNRSFNPELRYECARFLFPLFPPFREKSQRERQFCNAARSSAASPRGRLAVGAGEFKTNASPNQTFTARRKPKIRDFRNYSQAFTFAGARLKDPLFP